MFALVILSACRAQVCLGWGLQFLDHCIDSFLKALGHVVFLLKEHPIYCRALAPVNWVHFRFVNVGVVMVRYKG